MAKKKTAKFNNEDINNLSDDKPVVYIIEDSNRESNAQVKIFLQIPY